MLRYIILHKLRKLFKTATFLLFKTLHITYEYICVLIQRKEGDQKELIIADPNLNTTINLKFDYSFLPTNHN